MQQSAPPPTRPNYDTLPPPVPAPPAPLPFRQDALWALCALLFFAYLTAVLYLFLTLPSFRRIVVENANGLFALPYVLSLFVVAVCLAPCAPPPRRDLDGVIAGPVDCLLVILVLLEWATCLALVLITLIAVHEGLSYISPEGLIVPAIDGPTGPSGLNSSSPNATAVQPGPKGGDGISADAVVVLVIPMLFMYTLFNLLLHVFSCIEAYFRRRRGLSDSD